MLQLEWYSGAEQAGSEAEEKTTGRRCKVRNNDARHLHYEDDDDCQDDDEEEEDNGDDEEKEEDDCQDDINCTDRSPSPANSSTSGYSSPSVGLQVMTLDLFVSDLNFNYID